MKIAIKMKNHLRHTLNDKSLSYIWNGRSKEIASNKILTTVKLYAEFTNILYFLKY